MCNQGTACTGGNGGLIGDGGTGYNGGNCGSPRWFCHGGNGGAGGASVTYSSSYLSATPTTTTLFTGMSVREVAAISGAINGGYVTGGPLTASPYFFSNDGATALAKR